MHRMVVQDTEYHRLPWTLNPRVPGSSQVWMFPRPAEGLGCVGSQPSARRSGRGAVGLRWHRLDWQAEPSADDRRDVTHRVALVGHGAPGGSRPAPGPGPAGRGLHRRPGSRTFRLLGSAPALPPPGAGDRLSCRNRPRYRSITWLSTRPSRSRRAGIARSRRNLGHRGRRRPIGEAAGAVCTCICSCVCKRSRA
jgi:hypothetical protein